jgi:hypothetical protein
VNEIRQIKAFASKLHPDELPPGSLRSGSFRPPLAFVEAMKELVGTRR